jgi:DNA-binding NtrC family response regulator
MKKIMIVDDNELIRHSLKKVFCSYQVETFAASNGSDALREISSRFYDLCLLDICLPDIHGIEAMKQIRALSPATKIAVMTSPPIVDDPGGFVEKEANYFIAKPFDLSDMKMLAKMLSE